MKRLILLIVAAALCLAGCGNAQIEPSGETSAPVTTVPATAAATQPAQTTQPAETAAATEQETAYVEVFREGEASQIPVETVRGTVGNYTMAMDPEFFTFHPQETVDLFSYDAWEDEPGVFYTVSDYRDDGNTQQFIDDTLAQFAPLFDTHSTEETTVAGYPATAVYLSGFIADPAYQAHIFLVNCDGNYYIIECSFVFEMYEGLYPIMRASFDTMTVVD